MIFRANKIKNYTKTDNRYLESKNISLKAKGLVVLHRLIFKIHI